MPMKAKNTLRFLLYILLMSSIMSGCVSFTVTLIHLGNNPDLVWHWLDAWHVAFLTAFPVASLAAPVARWITVKLVK